MCHGGGILLYARENKPFSKLECKPLKRNTKVFFVEINLRKKRLYLYCYYNPHKSIINEHLNETSKGLDSYLSNYDNMLIIGAFYGKFIA